MYDVIIGSISPGVGRRHNSQSSFNCQVEPGTSQEIRLFAAQLVIKKVKRKIAPETMLTIVRDDDFVCKWRPSEELNIDAHAV